MVAGVLSGAVRWELVHGEAFGLLRELPDACVDAVITDPPYSTGGMFRGDRAKNTTEKYVSTGVQTERPDFAGDNRDQRSFLAWATLWLTECQRVAKPGAGIVLFADWRQLPTMSDALQAGGWVWRGLAVWDKTEGARPQVGRFRAQCEYLLFGTNGNDEAQAEAIGVLPGCFRVPVLQADKHHITGKPTALMMEVVRFCVPGGLVLDPFAGSGTTLVAALATRRRGLGFERTAEYSEIARQRCEGAATGRDWKRPAQEVLFG